MKILALDPGITTGVVEFRDELDGDTFFLTQQWVLPHVAFFDNIEAMKPDIIVYESFVYQQRNKVELYPVEVIGVIKLYAQMHRTPIFVQSPSNAKGFMTDAKLKKMGLWKPGEKHAMDAMRHLMYHLIVTRKEIQWLESLRPEQAT